MYVIRLPCAVVLASHYSMVCCLPAVVTHCDYYYDELKNPLKNRFLMCFFLSFFVGKTNKNSYISFKRRWCCKFFGDGATSLFSRVVCNCTISSST